MPATDTSVTELIGYQSFKSNILVEPGEALNDFVKQLTKAERFVAVRGIEGSGKSVFLNHQLIPFLKNQWADDNRINGNEWRAIAFTPEINPIGALARSLAAPGVLREPQELETNFYQEIEKTLRSGSDGLIKLYQDATDLSISKGNVGFKLLIVVDELKQLFELQDQLIQSELLEYANLYATYQSGDDELFFELFRKAIRSDLPIYVTFSISNTSFGRLNNYQGWPEMISLNRFYLPEIEVAKVKDALFKLEEGDSHLSIHPIASKIYADLIKRYRENKQGNSIARLSHTLALLAKEHRSSSTNTATLKSQPILINDDYFNKIDATYQAITAAAHEIEYLCNDLYLALDSVDRLLIKRLFKAITVKDPTPGKVVQSNPCSFNNLIAICYRNGEEYDELRNELGADAVLFPETMEAKRHRLAKLIQRLQFPGTHLPKLVKVIDPSFGSQTIVTDDGIIDLGKGKLIMHWSVFREWIEEEYASFGFFKSISEQASDVRIPQPSLQAQPINESEEEFPRFNFFKDRFNQISRNLKEVFSRKQAQTSDPNTLSANDQLLSDGKIEVVKEWFSKVMPNSTWLMRYTSLKFKRGGEPLEQQLVGAKVGSLNQLKQVADYYLQSKHYRENIKLIEKNNAERKQRTSKRILWTVTGALALALIFIAVGITQSIRAKNAEANITLIEMIDRLDRINLLSAVNYPGGLRDLKSDVEKNKKITDKNLLLDYLEESKVINLRPAKQDDFHRRATQLAMLQLDSLGKRSYVNKTKELLTLSSHVIDNASSLLKQRDTAFQYPAVYKALHETAGIIQPELRKNTDYTSIEHGGFLKQSYAGIQALESNPKVKGQFVYGDAAGNVQLFINDTEPLDKLMSVNESISDMSYSRDGTALFVSSFAGNIYHYWPLASSINPESPKGLETKIKPTKLRIAGENQARKFPILSINATQSKDHLLIQDDVGLTLLRKISDGFYQKESYINLSGKVKALSAIAGNEDGTKFIVGGADASALITLTFRNNRNTLVDINIIKHHETSISAIAFEKQESGDQAIALGTESGKIILTSLSIIEQFGQKYTTEEDTKLADYFRETSSLHEFAVTHLTFNDPHVAGYSTNNTPINHQLISTSLDGSIWLFNLDLIHPNAVYTFKSDALDESWDHLKLSAGGSVSTGCLVNKDLFVTIESNSIRTWRTNLASLKNDLVKILDDYKSENN